MDLGGPGLGSDQSHRLEHLEPHAGGLADYGACGEACSGINPKGPCNGEDDCEGHGKPRPHNAPYEGMSNPDAKLGR